MSLDLLHKAPAGAIETLFDEQNQPILKTADLVKNIGMGKIRYKFKDFPSYYTCARPAIAR